MKRRILAVLLALCLVAGLVPTVFGATPTLENSVNMDQLVAHGISLFKALEAGGRWDSVTNTTTCVGMGIMGWINSSALQLLKWCATSSKGGDPELCKSYLGEELYNEVVNAPVAIQDELMPKWGYWGSRKFSSSELAAAKALLGSELGVRVQQNLARLYITKQAKRGWEAGVRTEAALLYYCSADNHYGEYGVKAFMNAVRSALGITSSDTINSLNIFHNGVVKAAKTSSTVSSTLAYRTKVYKYLVNTLQLDPGENPTPTPTPSPDPTPEVPFTDMPEEGHWAYDAIIWAYTNDPQVTAGTSATTFSPYATVTRAQAVTFLWCAAGKPAPKNTSNPFADVPSDAYYLKPILWAVEKGITSGTSATTFSPKDTVTLAQMITFIWVYAGKPSAGRTENPFSDIEPGDYYYKAVLWAYYGGILVGNEGSGGKLLPKTGCSRAYVVTYLYNHFVMTAH